ncbi:MAG: hypothetical protein ACI8X5_004090 [Planctomycetota bacterium]|jgi:uncharacterized protein (TIGR02466 family)
MLSNPFDPLPEKIGAGASALDQQLAQVEQLRVSGEYQAALVCADRLVAGHPKNANARNERGTCFRLVGQPEKAMIEFRVARQLVPDSAGIVANIAGCLIDLGEYEKALRAFLKALELQPDFAPVLAEIGTTYQRLGNLTKAIDYYSMAVAKNPTDSMSLSNLASARGELGEFDPCLEAASKCLDVDAHNREGIVFKSIALHELGREEEAALLFNLDWVRAFPISEVEGFPSVQAFNEALTAHVASHPSLEFEPTDRSTMLGEQTGELQTDSNTAIARLVDLIQYHVARFITYLPEDPAHPYLSRKPTEFSLSVWGTRLASGGHQAAHIHPGGWVSGVYYTGIPTEVSKDNCQHSGWIQFGGAPSSWPLERERVTHDFPPVEGTLILFPSYFYHRTLPFESDTKRVSIAFDAIPE